MIEPFFKESDCDIRIGDQSSKAYTDTHAISLSLANHLLRARSQVVYSTDAIGADWSDREGSTDTHRALLICVEPLISDSAEKIVEDFLASETVLKGQRVYSACVLEKLIDRAKKLREGK